jgi:tRNA pseudouridine55 synthase
MMPLDGYIIINKPAGMSSFQCLKIVKRKLRLEKVGFLGTLDPEAMGVLVLLCGKYTKRADELHAAKKVYRSVFRFGIETDTLDLVGKTIKTNDIIPTRAEIEKILPEMTGDLEIEVPAFSAVHIDGERAYDLARRGVNFTPPKRKVIITRFELCEGVAGRPQSPPEFGFEIECSAGTYIRSLAKLLAGKLGTVAVAAVIIRVRVGDFFIEDAKKIDAVTIDDIKQL